MEENRERPAALGHQSKRFAVGIETQRGRLSGGLGNAERVIVRRQYRELVIVGAAGGRAGGPADRHGVAQLLREERAQHLRGGEGVALAVVDPGGRVGRRLDGEMHDVIRGRVVRVVADQGVARQVREAGGAR